MPVSERAGIRLHYEIEGPADGPALVLCNSLGTDLHMWDAQIGPFAEHLRVVRFDAQGQGKSDSPLPPYSLDDLGTDLVQLLDELGIPKVHLCGVSMGGMVALWLAATHPERVDRAVFACTAARIGTPDFWNARIDVVRHHGMTGVHDTVMQRFFTGSSLAQPGPDVLRTGETLSAANEQGYVGACAALGAADLSDLVPDITAPSLIIAGSADEAVPGADSAWLSTHIEGARLVVLDDAAHLANVERPGSFNRAVLDFLTGT